LGHIQRVELAPAGCCTIATPLSLGDLNAPPVCEASGEDPARIVALFRRKWSWKDIALILLALSFVSMSAYAFREPISKALAKLRAGAQSGETVSVFDVGMGGCPAQPC